LKKIFLLILLLTSTLIQNVIGQTDSLILVNGDVIVGEMKGMERGVVTVETDYSKDDFQIEWKGVSEIFTNSNFVISLSNGTRLTGRLESVEAGKIRIITSDQVAYTYNMNELIYLKSFDTGFWDRVNAYIDFGFSLTKSQNLRQITLKSNIGYLVKKWSVNVSYNTFISSQDDADSIQRKDGSLVFHYFLPKDWFIPASITFSSNTEQKIDLRTLAKLGVGNYIIHTNYSYWGVVAGATYNNEKFSDDEDRSSWEGFFGTELNLYDIGDFSLLTRVVAYPSFTESGRWRMDFVLDTKYDLPLDFYIKLGITVDYDNQPVDEASETDYVLQTGIGWEW